MYKNYLLQTDYIFIYAVKIASSVIKCSYVSKAKRCSKLADPFEMKNLFTRIVFTSYVDYSELQFISTIW